MKHNEYIVTQALDAFFEGLSSRKCARNLEKYSRTKVCHETILSWVRKYTLKIHSYVQNLKPNLGEEQTTDETTIKTNGQKHELGFVLDIDTRFVTVSKYWNKKGCELTPEDITELWKKAKQIQKPKKWKTDGHVSYPEAFKKVFYSRYKIDKVDWEKNITSKTKKFNNKIERLNRNLKDRLRTIYGFKAAWSASIILQGWVIYYNFIRPHIGLENLTPAQAAGLHLDLGKNNWLGLIQLAA
jgi:transposase-like protein